MFNIEPINPIDSLLRGGGGMREGRGRSVRKRHQATLSSSRAVVSRKHRRSGAVDERSRRKMERQRSN